MELLEKALIPSIEEPGSQVDDFILKDDSVPCHRTKLVNVNILLMDVSQLTNFTLQ